MDLVNSIVNLQQASILGQVQIAVAKQILDAQTQSGQGALKLLQAASQNVNNAGDQLAAAATGLGGQLDVQA